MEYKEFIPLIKEEEVHPATVSALMYLKDLGMLELQSWFNYFTNKCSNENELANKCGDTLQRFFNAQQISERDLLALVWVLRFDYYGEKNKYYSDLEQEHKRRVNNPTKNNG